MARPPKHVLIRSDEERQIVQQLRKPSAPTSNGCGDWTLSQLLFCVPRTTSKGQSLLLVRRGYFQSLTYLLKLAQQVPALGRWKSP